MKKQKRTKRQAAEKGRASYCCCSLLLKERERDCLLLVVQATKSTPPACCFRIFEWPPKQIPFFVVVVMFNDSHPFFDWWGGRTDRKIFLAREKIFWRARKNKRSRSFTFSFKTSEASTEARQKISFLLLLSTLHSYNNVIL